MRHRGKKRTADSIRSHLMLLTCVSLLTGLVVLLGRRPLAQDTQLAPLSPLELRRPVALSIRDPGNVAAGSITTVTPIPLPGDLHRRTTTVPEFVPLGRMDSPAPEERSAPSRPDSEITLPVDLPAAELRWHRVVEGESLETIAYRYLGREDRAGEIFALNRDLLLRPDVLPLGAHLRLPPR